jgi:acyl-coenzyme A thioesterase PaaI-like protein
MPGVEVIQHEIQKRAPSPLPRVRSENALKNAEGEFLGTDVLSSIDWVQELFDVPDTKLLATCGAMSSKPLSPDTEILNTRDATSKSKTTKTGVDPDHLFLTMLRQRLIDDICFMWNSKEQIFHTLVALGPEVAGHPRVTHGGFTSAVIDETTGGLVYELKKAGLLGEGPAYTARLEVDFKKPLPVDMVVCCTAKVMSIEGRKIWVSAEMLDKPGGLVFATGKALYVTPRQQQVENNNS